MLQSYRDSTNEENHILQKTKFKWQKTDHEYVHNQPTRVCVPFL